MHTEGVDLPILMEDTKYLQLLAKVHQKAGRPENALEALTRAREKQSKYNNKYRELNFDPLGLKGEPSIFFTYLQDLEKSWS